MARYQFLKQLFPIKPISVKFEQLLQQPFIKNSLNHMITFIFICSFTAFWLLL